MFIFSLSIGITALVLGGVAISRTNTSAPIVPSVTNNFPAPAAPATPATPTPAPQQSLSKSITATGNKEAFYFLTFYNNDPTCSSVSKLYDPIADTMNIGLISNPVRIDRSQSDCFNIAYMFSAGSISATSRYLSYRQYTSNDCSGVFTERVRSLAPSAKPSPENCYSDDGRLYYRATVTNPGVSALNYPLPSIGHESMDYDPQVNNPTPALRAI